MEKLLQRIEKKELQHTIAHLYIQNYELRVTYHLDDTNTNFWTHSDYYNSNEIVDTGNIYNFLNLDYRERDYSDTLLEEQWFFLVWEMIDSMPEYLKKFAQEYSDKIESNVPKIIKRTFGNKILVYLKLKLPAGPIQRMRKYSKQVQEILQKM